MVLFTVGLPAEFLTEDTRFAVFAQEMLRNGPTFFPTTYGNPYPDYPATGTFLVYLASLPSGHVTPLSATLPTAVASSLVLVFTYLIGAMHSRRWGAMAVLIALFTKTFLSLSRCVSLDQFVSLTTVASFYVIYSADLLGRRRRLWLVPLLMAGGFAMRGPLGVVVPAGVICSYYAFGRDIRRLLYMGGAAAVVVVVGWKLLLMAAAYQGGPQFVADVVRMQFESRLTETAAHGHLYYLINGPAKYAMAFPLALAAAGLCWRSFWKPASKEHALLRLLGLWALVVIVGLSLASEKKIRYILPAVPPLALLASWLFVQPMAEPVLQKLRQTLTFCCRVLPVVAALYGIVGLVMGWSSGGANYAALATFGGLFAAVVFLHARTTDEAARDAVSVAAGALTMALLVICVSEKAAYAEERSRPFAVQVESLLKQRPAPVAIYGMDSDKQGLRLLANCQDKLLPDFIGTPDEMAALQGTSYVIAREDDVRKMPGGEKLVAAALYRGRLDTENCVILLKE